MKPNLGKGIIVIALCFSPLWGSYEWKLLDHPTILNVGQNGLVRYACAFDGSASEYSIQLLLESTPHYTTSLLNQHTTMVKGKRIEIVELLITPKVAGKLTLSPNARVRFTALGAVENTVLGRDNLSKEDIINTQTHLHRSPSTPVPMGLPLMVILPLMSIPIPKRSTPTNRSISVSP